MRRKHHALTRVLIALLSVMAALVAVSPGQVAGAATAVSAARNDDPGTALGYDISNYQCTQTLPVAPQFVVIEAEGAPYKHTTSTACLQSQYSYAAAAAQPQFYIYASDTDNRGGANSVSAACSSAPSAACVHNYAEGAAQDAVAQLDAAALPVAPSTWWVDVECSTAPCPDWMIGRNDLNQAAILGYVDGLRSRADRVGQIGFYSTTYQWSHITGQSGGLPAFGVEGLPVWYASAASSPAAGAATYCGQPGFTGGPIAIVQSAPVNYTGSNAQIDPDVACAPMIATVTQNVVAGGIVTATGIDRPNTTLTLSLADSFTPLKPFANVTTDGSGHWSLGFHLGSNGTLTVADPDGSMKSVGITVTAKITVTKSRAYGRDRIGHCIDRLDGTVYPYVVGARAIARGARDKQIGYGKINKVGASGSWSATAIVPCGKVTTTKVTYSGLLPGNGVRFAGDGRTAAVTLPANYSSAKR